MKLFTWPSLAALLATLFIHQFALADIVIGQTAGFTGAASTNVKEMTLGARLIIDHVNANGGIKGQSIKLISLDDEFDVKRAASNAEILIKDKKALALFLNRGTPHSEAIAPVLASYGVPLIAPSTGAMSIQQPPLREIFPVRPSYQKEAERMVSQLWGMGFRKIVCVHVADAFGRDTMKGVERRMQELNWKPVEVVDYDRQSEDVSKAVEVATRKVGDEYPAVLIIGSSRATSTLINRIRSSGSRAYVAAMSTVASAGFIKTLGEHANFVMVAQVFPKETATHIPIVRKTTDLLKASGSTQAVTPAMLEGAVASELLIEALRRCPSPCTSKALIATLESGKPFNVGWPDQDLVYTPTKRAGISFADTSIISAGRYRR